MRSMPYKLLRESFRSMRLGGRVHPAYVVRCSLKHRQRRAVISAGTSDDVAVFKLSPDSICVLSFNRRLGYAGIESFETDDDNLNLMRTYSFFEQSSEQLEQIVGRRWDELMPATLAARLISQG